MGKIFLVDDSFFMREMLKGILKDSSKLKIIGEAADGMEALEKLEYLKADIVTLDITMKGMDGIRTLSKLKSKFPDIKVVMCSAMGQKPIVKEALEMGAEDFIIKPFRKAKVREVLEKLN